MRWSTFCLWICSPLGLVKLTRQEGIVAHANDNEEQGVCEQDQKTRDDSKRSRANGGRRVGNEVVTTKVLTPILKWKGRPRSLKTAQVCLLCLTPCSHFYFVLTIAIQTIPTQTLYVLSLSEMQAQIEGVVSLITTTTKGWRSHLNNDMC